MKNQEIKQLVKGIINNNGICGYCDKQRIEYGIINGSYWYYCHNCKKIISKDEISTTNQRLEYLRQEIRAERISYAEIAELQSLAEHIDPSDTELLEWAGVEEGGQQ